MIGNGFDEISLSGADASAPKPWTSDRTRSDTFDLDAAFNHIGFGPFQVKVVLSCGLFLGVDAMEIMLLSFVGPALQCDWSITSDQKALLPFTVFLGAFCGAYFWGTIADLHGRRPVILTITAAVFILGVLSAIAPNYAFLAVCRAGVGFFTGGTNVVVSYCIEMLPTEKRGFYGIFIESFWTVGTVIQVLLAWAIFATATR